MGLEIFRDEVMDNENVRKRSVDGLLKMIEEEREGRQVSLCLLMSLKLNTLIFFVLLWR